LSCPEEENEIDNNDGMENTEQVLSIDELSVIIEV
jgi:hypothetical protein